MELLAAVGIPEPQESIASDRTEHSPVGAPGHIADIRPVLELAGAEDACERLRRLPAVLASRLAALIVRVGRVWALISISCAGDRAVFLIGGLLVLIVRRSRRLLGNEMDEPRQRGDGHHCCEGRQSNFARRQITRTPRTAINVRQTA